MIIDSLDFFLKKHKTNKIELSPLNFKNLK